MTTTRPRGRPRDVDADERILTATFEALATVGYEALTVDKVAAEAGVAKTTLYRRWATKEELVLRCLQRRATINNPAPTGDWRADIGRAVKSLVELMSTKEGRAFISVMAAAYNNPDLSMPFSRQYDGPPATIHQALIEGVQSGELRGDLDIDLTMDLFVSAIMFRILALNEDTSIDASDSIVRAVLDGARPR